MKKIIFALLFTGFVLSGIHAEAQCSGSSPNWTAATANESDVVNCKAVASPGDTINIPSGDVVWASTFVDDKGLNLVGTGSSGAGATKITYGAYAALSIQVSSPNKFSVSNIWFNRSGNLANSMAIVIDGNTTPANGWKIFNNQFTGYSSQSGSNDIQVDSPSYGVIFDNVFNDPGLESISIYMLLPANQTEPWATPLTSIVGSTNIVFVEGNTWNLSSAQSWNSFHAITSGRGSRYEARYNTTIKAGTGFASVYDAHGYCGSYESSGSQFYDIHHNLITDNGGYGWYANIRGGNGLVHDNAFSGSFSTGQNLNFEEYRADVTDSVTYACVTQATNSPNLYPLIYQTTEMYMYNNGPSGYSIDSNNYESTYLQVGRDIHLNAPTVWTYADSTCPNAWTGLTGSCTTSSAGVAAYNVGGSGVSLTVSTSGVGTGAVSGTNCSTGSYTSGTAIGPCTAIPTGSSVFTGWVTSGSAPSCTGLGTCPSSGSFSLTATTTITATFGTPVTVATGDTRTITEPVIPTGCAQLQATKYIVSTNAVNIDPYNATCGSTGGTFGTLGCTGGTSYEPSSSSGSYVASESLDNSALTSAFSSASCVEVVPGSGGQLGLVMAPFSIPSGKSLILDAGTHVFASRNRTDYGGTNCGIVTTGSSSCNHWITSPSTTGSGIYGYGVLDARGWDAFIGSTTQGFYANRIQAYCNNHGGAIDGSPACTVNSSGNNSYGPNALNLVGANNFTLYKTTIKDAGNFIFNWQTGNGLVAWGAKLIAPFEVSNTDGFDPLSSTNGTFTNGIISNGDNHVAVKATSAASTNITVSNTQTGAGIALALGTDINTHGISNVLFNNITQRGNLYNTQSAGLQIGSSSANGGVADQITFKNVCMVDESSSIRLYTNYGGQTGTSIPVYTNVLLENIHVLASTAPYTTGNSGKFTFQGLSGHPLGVQVDNLVIDGTNQGVASQSGVTTDQYANIYLGPGAVSSSLLTQFSAGTSVVTTGSAGTGTPYNCTTSSWKPLVGELNLANATANNNQSYTGSAPFTLQAVLQPATEISTKESPALTQPVTFLDNGVSIGTAALSGDGTFASFAVTAPPTGTHTYTARYPGDANYPAFTFGNVSLTNGTSGTTPPAPGVLSVTGVN